MSAVFGLTFPGLAVKVACDQGDMLVISADISNPAVASSDGSRPGGIELVSKCHVGKQLWKFRLVLKCSGKLVQHS